MRRPSPPAILETALYARDLAAAEGFYADVLGLEVVLRLEGRHVFFRCRDSMLLVFDPAATMDAAAEPQFRHGATGPGHACFAATEAEIDAWRALFEEHGIAIEADMRWPDGARSLYVRDPAGNSIEFAEPRLWGFSSDAPE